MNYKKIYTSPWGELEVARNIFQKNSEGKTFVPIDAAWGMEDESIMHSVQEYISLECANNPISVAHHHMSKIPSHPIRLHPTQIKNYIKRSAKRIEEIKDELDQNIRAGEVAPEGARVFVASMDGVNVPLNEKGKKRGRPQKGSDGRIKSVSTVAYKNAMVGCFSHYGDVLEGEKTPQRLSCRYTSHMPQEGFCDFKKKFEAEATAAEASLPAGTRQVFVSDAAGNIWNYIDGNPLYDGYEKIVDFWHSAEHLSKLAEAMFGNGTVEYYAWFDKYRRKLLEEDGGAERVIASVAYYFSRLNLSTERGAEVLTQRTFFKRNKKRMSYARFRREGLPVGSGPVEAACKSVVKDRFCKSGMRWSRIGGQRILDLRTYAKSGRWDVFWNGYMKLKRAS